MGKKIIVGIISILYVAFDLGFAQNFSGGFNFYLPPDDTSSKKFLPSFPIKPIGDQDFVNIDSDGNFSVQGNKIRFWGTNLVADGAFPTKSKASFIAGRLRKYGFNLVRFHHMDNPWSRESIFEWGSDTRHLNPLTLDRFENIVNELKKNGIYVNINLHVSRTFKVQDGVENADSIVEFGKGVTLFDPQLIALQKDLAQQLLTHVNPYTGKSLVNDPVMAMVEIVNENSLYRIWRDGKLKSRSDGGWLIFRHVRMLDSLWNEFLFAKYSTTANLAASWNRGLISPGSDNQIINGDFENQNISANWIMEQHGGASAVFSRDTVNPYSGSTSVKINVVNTTGTSWHIQFKQIRLTTKKDSLYTIQFSARADSSKQIQVNVMRDNSPYTYYTGKSFLLSTNWRTYSFSFKASETNVGQVRLAFQFENNKGNFWFDEITMARSGVKGLLSGESLEAKNVKRIDFSECAEFSDNRVIDISDFYIKLQNDFFDTMKSYLKNTLGVRVPITGTNWNVGPADLAVQSKLGYIDNHAYWDHPWFPSVPWSSTDWFINNQPMVKSTDAGTIPSLYAGVPFERKPFTISEYNHAYPNRYQSESILFSTAYLSLHNADGIMFFDYNNSTNDWETDKINNFFSIHRNSVYMAQMPSSAFAYRNNLIKKANQTILLKYSSSFLNLLPKIDGGGWTGVNLFPKLLGLKHSIRNQSFDSDSTTDFSQLPQPGNNPYKSDTEEITYNTNGLLYVGTSKFVGLSGYLNNFVNTVVGNLTLKAATGFGTLNWLSLSDDSLSVSKHSLVTITSMIQNTGMLWDGTTTVHNNWGSAPTTIYPLTIFCRMNIYADSIRVYPLDTRGDFDPANYQTYFPTTSNLFDVAFVQSTARALWFGIEKFGHGSLTSVENSEREGLLEFRLKQNYPNPFNNSTMFNYTVPFLSQIKLEVFNVLGQKIRTLITDKIASGKYSISWDATNDSGEQVNSGIYFVTLSSDKYFNSKKVIFLK
ncbi:MAG: carbohydrate binding domain-containing protein [Bacteroidetes bacterium]|nr:carbohydrate binding domain-containing protein [Bacteroidota bacterium]